MNGELRLITAKLRAWARSIENDGTPAQAGPGSEDLLAMADEIDAVNRRGQSSDDRFGIVNPYGDLWSLETFDREDDAWAHLRDFYKNMGQSQPPDFKVERVSLLVAKLQIEDAE